MVRADLITYVDVEQFQSAAPNGILQTLDFDNYSTGTLASGSSLDGIDFTYDFGPDVHLRIVDSFTTFNSWARVKAQSFLSRPQWPCSESALF